MNALGRGRPSAAALSVVPIQFRGPSVEPPGELNEREVADFVRIVASVPPDHFKPADAELIATYVQVTREVRRLTRLLRKPRVFSRWREAVRLQSAVATKLRLTTRSRIDPKKAARAARSHQPSAYDAMGKER